MAKRLKLTLVKSIIGLSPKQEATVHALGLRRIRQVVEHDDTPTIRGMIRHVGFALKVEGRGADVAGRGAAVAGRGEPKASRADTEVEPRKPADRSEAES